MSGPTLERLEEDGKPLWAIMPLAPIDALDTTYGKVLSGHAPPPGLSWWSYDAMRRDGWLLVAANGEITDHLTLGSLPDGLKDVLAVYRTPSGRVALGTWRMTVVMRGDRPAAGWRGFLSGLGLPVIRAYPWRRPAFSVRIPFQALDPRGFIEKVVDQHGSLLQRASVELLFHVESSQQSKCGDYDADTQSWPWFDEQVPENSKWHLQRVRACDAWEVTRGAGVRIAVIDQGFDAVHPNLAVNYCEHSVLIESESAGDISAFADPADLRDESAESTQASGPNQLNLPHGTACAGLAAAGPTDESDVRGAAFEADLMLVAVANWTSVEIIGRAIDYGVDPSREANLDILQEERADIITCSLNDKDFDEAREGQWESEQDEEPAAAPSPGPEGLPEALGEALTNAKENGRETRGTPVFWAVRNSSDLDDGGDLAEDPVAQHESVISVGKTDFNDSTPGHAYGEGMDVVAPGIALRTTRSGGDGDVVMGTKYGTSYATPFAAGVGALLLAANQDLGLADVRRILRESCEKVTPDTSRIGAEDLPENYDAGGWHPVYGYGRIDAGAAVEAALEAGSSSDSNADGGPEPNVVVDEDNDSGPPSTPGPCGCRRLIRRLFGGG